MRKECRLDRLEGYEFGFPKGERSAIRRLRWFVANRHTARRDWPLLYQLPPFNILDLVKSHPIRFLALEVFPAIWAVHTCDLETGGYVTLDVRGGPAITADDFQVSHGRKVA